MVIRYCFGQVRVTAFDSIIHSQKVKAIEVELNSDEGVKGAGHRDCYVVRRVESIQEVADLVQQLINVRLCYEGVNFREACVPLVQL